MRFKKPDFRSKFSKYFCHWCKKYSSSRKKWTWKHEDQCLDNPHVILYIRKLNGLNKMKDYLQIALNDSADYLNYLEWNKRK